MIARANIIRVTILLFLISLMLPYLTLYCLPSESSKWEVEDWLIGWNLEHPKTRAKLRTIRDEEISKIEFEGLRDYKGDPLVLSTPYWKEHFLHFLQRTVPNPPGDVIIPEPRINIWTKPVFCLSDLFEFPPSSPPGERRFISLSAYWFGHHLGSNFDPIFRQLGTEQAEIARKTLPDSPSQISAILIDPWDSPKQDAVTPNISRIIRNRQDIRFFWLTLKAMDYHDFNYAGDNGIYRMVYILQKSGTRQKFFFVVNEEPDAEDKDNAVDKALRSFLK